MFSSERIPSVALDRKTSVSEDGIALRRLRPRGARAGSM